METGPDGRKRVDLTALPAWARLLLAVGTVVLVGATALLLRAPSGHRTLPATAVVAAVLAFAIATWPNRPRR